MQTIVIGDDVSWEVQLYKKKLSFTISGGATVTAAIVSPDHEELYLGPTAQSNSGGADWANSLVVVKFPKAETAVIPSPVSRALLKIQVEDGGEKLSWIDEEDIRIVKGHIP